MTEDPGPSFPNEIEGALAASQLCIGATTVTRSLPFPPVLHLRVAPVRSHRSRRGHCRFYDTSFERQHDRSLSSLAAIRVDLRALFTENIVDVCTADDEVGNGWQSTTPDRSVLSNKKYLSR